VPEESPPVSVKGLEKVYRPFLRVSLGLLFLQALTGSARLRFTG
jgi:hypothetical protein